MMHITLMKDFFFKIVNGCFTYKTPLTPYRYQLRRRCALSFIFFSQYRFQCAEFTMLGRLFLLLESGFVCSTQFHFHEYHGLKLRKNTNFAVYVTAAISSSM
jgi:hypothetical protein